MNHKLIKMLSRLTKYFKKDDDDEKEEKTEEKTEEELEGSQSIVEKLKKQVISLSEKDKDEIRELLTMKKPLINEIVAPETISTTGNPIITTETIVPSDTIIITTTEVPNYAYTEEQYKKN